MYKTIVCAIGMGSREKMQHLVKTSCALLAPGGALHLVHAVERPPSVFAISPEAWAVEVIRDAQAKLHDISRFLPEAPSIHVEIGHPHEIILAIARAVFADLIVISAHKEDLLDRLFGSTVDRIVHQAPCSVHIDRLALPSTAKAQSDPAKENTGS